VEEIIQLLTSEILKVRRIIESLNYQQPSNVDKHDDDLSSQKKKIVELRRIRLELEELI